MKKGFFSSLLFCLLGLFVICVASARAQPGGPPRDEAFSANRKFSVEISETEINNPRIAVFSRDGESAKLVWSRRLNGAADLDDPNTSAFSPGRGIRKNLSNDGTTVILRPEYAHNEEAAVRILTQKGGDASFGADDLTAILEDAIDEEHPQLFSGGQSMMELFLEDEKPPLFALWFPSAARWLVINLTKLEAEPAAGETATRLDGLGLARAREIVRQSQGGGGLTRVLNTLRRKAAEIVPGMIDAQPQGADSLQSQVAYRFLAAQKKPEDRPLVEKLLEEKLDGTRMSGGFGVLQMGIGSSDRLLGEELLAKWDGVSREEVESRPGRPSFGRRKSKWFGTIEGTIFLPFKTPDQAGRLWLYLIPAAVPQGDWAKDESVVSAEIGFNDMMFGPPGNRPTVRYDKMRFALETLTPGGYRLKAVWDRRSPTTGQGRPPGTTVTIAEAGDYESAESAIFRVAAGERIRDVALECTNRVGGTSKSYEVDQSWAEKHPASREEPEEEDLPPWQMSREKLLVNAPVGDWMIRTNENTGDLHITRIRLVESVNSRTGKSTKRLAVRFRAPAPKRKNDWANYQGRLEDEHGCRFEAGGANLSRRSHEVHFPIVPYGARQIKLVILLQNEEVDSDPRRAAQHKAPGASFLLKNLFDATAEEWKADSLPARRELDLVTVELTEVDAAAPEYSADYLSRVMGHFTHGYGPGGQRNAIPENRFTLLREGAPATGWRKLSGSYRDRWGNESASLSSFCAMEELFKLSAEFAREPDKANYLPREIWEVPLAKVPGAGESVPLNLTNELEGLKVRLYSVGGTGEFSYENGTLVAATNRLGDGGFNARFMPGNRSPQPKLFQVNSVPPHYYGGRRPPGPVTIGSRIPHLACRVPDAGGDPLFALLEEDTSVPEPMSTPPQHPGGGYWGGPRIYSALKFLPLDFRPRETDRTLTFIVQKPRKAEFVIHVPRSARPSQGN